MLDPSDTTTLPAVAAGRYGPLISQVRSVMENFDRLTPRQREVVEMVALTTLVRKEIAHELGIDINTVKAHITAAKIKLHLDQYPDDSPGSDTGVGRRWSTTLAFALGVRYCGEIERLLAAGG